MKFKIKSARQGETKSFKSLFPDVLNDFNIEKLFTVEALVSQWPEIAGELLATHSIPDRIYKGVLFLAVDHSVYGNEIILMKDVILKKIASLYGKGLVRSVKTEVRPLKWIHNR